MKFKLLKISKSLRVMFNGFPCTTKLQKQLFLEISETVQTELQHI